MKGRFQSSFNFDTNFIQSTASTSEDELVQIVLNKEQLQQQQLRLQVGGDWGWHAVGVVDSFQPFEDRERHRLIRLVTTGLTYLGMSSHAAGHNRGIYMVYVRQH